MRGLKCFKCEKYGHVVKNSPLKRVDESNMTEEKEKVQQTNEGIALTTTSSKKENNQWFIDSGATKHMTFQRNIITNYKKYEEPSIIFLGDNTIIKAFGEGNVKLECYDGEENVTLNLHRVLYAPDIKKNLLLVPAMTQMNAEVIFDDEKCYTIKDKKTVNIGHLTDSKLFVLNTQPTHYVNVAKAPSLKQWHCSMDTSILDISIN